MQTILKGYCVFILLFLSFWWEICIVEVTKLDIPIRHGSLLTSSIDTSISTPTATPTTTTTGGSTGIPGESSHAKLRTTTLDLKVTADHTPWCPTQNDSGCPKLWYTVNDTMCLFLNTNTELGASDDQCVLYDAPLPAESDITNIKTCLRHLLQNSTVEFIFLKSKNYLHVINWTESANEMSFHSVCLLDKEKMAPPVITSFTLENYEHPTTRWRQDLLNNINPDLVVVAADDTLNFTCKASGYPRPEVTITRDNVTVGLDTPGTLLIRRVGCQESGVYGCLAKNFLNSTYAQKMIQFSYPVEIQSFTIARKRLDTRPIRTNVSVNMTCSVKGCPHPKFVNVTDDDTDIIIASAAAGSSVTHIIQRLQCSDVGRYYCKVSGEDDKIVMASADLEINECESTSQRHRRKWDLREKIDPHLDRRQSDSEIDTFKDYLPIVVCVVIGVIAMIAAVIYYRDKMKGNCYAVRNRQREPKQGSSTEMSLSHVCPSEEYQQDSGRIISEEGLVYVTVIHATGTGKREPTRSRNKILKASYDPEDHVEYVTLDYEKTAKFVITKEEEDLAG